MATTRREFLGAALATGALAVLAPRGAQGSDARISVLINEPVGTISPNLYSHFVEHLGGVVYDGIFVATPNFHVFEMYAAHQGAQAVRTEFVAPRVAYTRTVINNRQRAEFWGL